MRPRGTTITRSTTRITTRSDANAGVRRGPGRRSPVGHIGRPIAADLLRAAAGMSAHRIFLLSPASTAGKRAATLLREEADFALARRLRESGAPLGEVFAFMSALYFRGKLAYATAFGRAPAGVVGALVITSSRGLLPADTVVGPDDLHAFAGVPIDPAEPRYREPLVTGVQALAEQLGPADEVVLLGSIASGKYLEILLEVLGDRLLFPEAFVGRGDMSRGGLLLRCVEDECELAYVRAADAGRRGSRPPRLAPRR
jgi:hypothetical protein